MIQKLISLILILSITYLILSPAFAQSFDIDYQKENNSYDLKSDTINLKSLIELSTLKKSKINFTELISKPINQNNFSNGVLATNTNKSIYSTNESVFIQLASLDEYGRTLCNSELVLEITDPLGNTITPKIQKSGICDTDNITNLPDYFTYYQTSGVGEYKLKLTNSETHLIIYDHFEVKDFSPFDIERKGPTRTYPQGIYENIIEIKANQDFNGYIEDILPAGFSFLDTASSNEYNIIENLDNSSTIRWYVSLVKGKNYQFKYRFLPSKISPFLYFLGPLKFFNTSNNLIFKESRSWQIASDLPATVYLSSTASTKVTAVTAWQIITTNNTAANTNTGAQQKRTTGYTQFTPGSANGTNSLPIPTAPNGKGFIYDTSVLGAIPSGTWTFNVRTTNSNASGTGYITVCVWKVRLTNANNVGTFSTIINCVDGATNVQANTTANYSSSVSVGSVPSTTFMSDEYLYVEYWLHTTVAGGSATGNVTFETNTVNDTIVTPGASTSVSPISSNLGQYNTGHSNILTAGGSNTTGNLNLDIDVNSINLSETITPKVEVRDNSSSFNNTATHTGSAFQYNPSEPDARRSMVSVYDSTYKRMIVFGGWDGTTNFNDVWSLDLSSNILKPQWKKLSPTGTPPTARRLGTAVYDPINQRMVMFGGYTTNDTNEIWQLTLPSSGDGAWTQLSPSGTPPPIRSNCDAVYDPVNNRMVIYGGWGASRYTDLYMLSLSSGSEAWSHPTPGGSAPPNGTDYTAVYDSLNRRMVIFGGTNGTTTYNTTYALSLTSGSETWTQLSPAGNSLPPVSKNFDSVYDPVNQRLIAFEGWNGTNISNQIWDLNLVSGYETWTERTQSDTGGLPAPTYGHTAIYDPDQQRMIVFGGYDISGKNQRHTLSIDLIPTGQFTVKQISLLNYMQGRDAMAPVYDSTNNKMVIFGGYGRIKTTADLYSGIHVNETWAFNYSSGGTSTWYDPIKSGSGPPAREGAVTIYDSDNQRMIMFGGLTGQNITGTLYYNDVWELSSPSSGNATWRKLNPTGSPPSGRWLSAGVYDPVNQRFVIFGGEDSSGAKADTWQLTLPSNSDGAWTQLSPGGVAPSARAQMGVVYDSANNRMIITHGGVLTGTVSYKYDTYSLSLTAGSETWTNRTPGAYPGQRRGLTCVYDNAYSEKRMVCYGGWDGSATSFGDVWKLNVTTPGSEAWTQITPNGIAPQGRRSHGAVYDPINQQMIMYGGRPVNPPFFNDTWTLSLESNSASWTWKNIDPLVNLRAIVNVSGLSAGSYHWQGWATGSNSGDSSKISYGNSPDFIVTSNITQSSYRVSFDNGSEVHNWYDSNWGYRKPVPILNSNSTDLSNYQISVVLDTASLISAGKMKSDCSDVRFTDDDGQTILNFWRETSCNTSSTKFWVKVPTILATRNKLIYLYYGYPSAVDASNGNNTFIFFDDFNDNSIDGSKWTTVSGGGGSIAETGQELRITSNGTDRIYLRTSNTYTAPYIFEISAKKSENIELYSHWDGIIGTSGDMPQNSYNMTYNSWDSTTSMKISKDTNSSESNLATTNLTLNSLYHTYKEIAKTDGLNLYYDGNLLLSTSDTTFSSGYLALSAREQPAAVNAYYDNFRIRAYAVNEPTTSIGTEVTKPNSGATWKTAENTKTALARNQNIRLRFGVGTGGVSITKTFRLQVAPIGASPNCEAVANGNFSDVPTFSGGCGTSVACVLGTSHYSDGSAITNQLSPTGSLWASGKAVKDSSNQGTITLGQYGYTELEFAFQFTSNATTNADYCLRVSDSGSALNTYLNIARLTYPQAASTTIKGNTVIKGDTKITAP